MIKLANIIRGTTPTLELIVPPDKLNLSDVTSLLIPISQRNEVLVLKDMGEVLVDTQENTIGIYLTEEETLKFEVGNAEIQLIYWIDTAKYATSIATFRFNKILYEKDSKTTSKNKRG